MPWYSENYSAAPRRIYEDHLGMRSRRPTAVSSFASVGATKGDADRIAAAERAARSRGASQSDNALPVTGVCLMTPLLAFLVFVYAVPFIGVAAWRASCCSSQASSQYERLKIDPLVFSVFLRTFRICLIVTVLSVVAAYAISYVWVRGTRASSGSLVEFCILDPSSGSRSLRAFGWPAPLSNRGLITTWLQAAGLIAGPLPLAYNEFSVILGITHVLVPFRGVPACLLDAIGRRARALGCSRASAPRA